MLYQTLWTREFAFVFGTSDLAIATVLAAYMAGLALGSFASVRWMTRIRRPVLVYAALEFAIALCAIAVPHAIGVLVRLSTLLFGGRATLPNDADPLLAAFWLSSSFVILLVPTAAMGATLPVLARHVVRSEQEIGPRIGILYAINTFGAVLGTIAAAFFLLPALGLRGTAHVGVATNLVVFALAATLARRAREEARGDRSLAAAIGPENASASATRADALGDGRARFMLPLMLLSGAASFADEVLWTRLLAHLVGGSVYAFASMLASFLTGITLGSLVASRLATSQRRAARGFALAELGSALAALLAFFALPALPELARRAGAGVAGGLAANAVLASLVLVPSTLFLGATFPFAVRVLACSERDAGPASARVLAFNTLGAIAGALGAGFFALPALGFAGTLTLTVAIRFGLALGGAWLLAPIGRRLAAAAAIGLVAGVVLRPEEPLSLLRWSPFDRQVADGDVVWFGVGRSADVMLHEGNAHWVLRSNGLPEASILPPGQRAANTTADALGVLPVLARPEARRLLMIGLGGGTALESVPASIESIDVIELEPKIVEANRVLTGKRARDPLADPRVALHLGDARGALLLTSQRWDVIVSQPSHPWTAGASHLYTREFFAQIRQHLAPRGVFLQWIGASFVDERLLRSLVATLTDVFPFVRVYRPAPRPQFLFLASDAPLPLELDAGRALARDPDAFANDGFACVEDTLAALALDETGALAFAAGAPVSTDDRNLLQMRSPRILRAPLGIAGADAVLAPHDPLRRVARSFDRLALVRRLLLGADDARAGRWIASLDDPDLRRVASALRTIHALDVPDPAAPIDEARARVQRAGVLRDLADVLARHPDWQEARFAALSLQRSDVIARTLALASSIDALDALGRAVVEGWRAEAAGDFDALRALDGALALGAPCAPARLEALRLRVHWRLAEGDVAAAHDALPLIDRRLALAGNSVDDLLLRARASLRIGRPVAVVGALVQVASRLDGRRPGDRERASEALALLDALGEETIEFRDPRPRIEQRLRKLARTN